MPGDVLIVAEHLDRRLAPSSLELMTAARPLASAAGGSVRAAVLGHDIGTIAEHLASFGVEVLLVDDPSLEHYTAEGYGQALQALIAQVRPRVLLVAHTSQGSDLAPGLAGVADLPLITNCFDVRLEGDRLIASRRLLNEKVQAEFEITSDRPFIATIRPGSAKSPAPAPGGRVTSVPASIDRTKISSTFLGIEAPEVSDVDLSAADVIVSAGRGIQKKDNLPIVEGFAKAIGGVVGASRPLTDMDWLPKSRQVGQSGTTVRPKLYVACGISGAMQHVAGMKDAGLIIAINTDPSAPIFEIAHVGVVADVLKLLPLVTKELKA